MFLRQLLIFIGVGFSIAEADVSELIQPHRSELYVIDFLPQQNIYGLRIWTSQSVALALQLPSSDSVLLENDQFKLVEGVSETPLTVEDADGRNVLFHLNRAKSFFERIDPATVEGLTKTTVRLRMEQGYNATLHFAAQEVANDALTIPANPQGLWNGEIWFLKQVPKFQWRTTAAGSAAAITSFLLSSSPAALIGIPIALHSSYDIGFDGVKIPTAIYHEYVHRVLDREEMLPVMLQPRVLSEDIADYFAIAISGEKSYANMPEFANKRWRRNYRTLFNRLHLTRYNNHSFDLVRVLLRVRALVGKNRGAEFGMPNIADCLVWKALKEMNGSFKVKVFLDRLKYEWETMGTGLNPSQEDLADLLPQILSELSRYKK